MSLKQGARTIVSQCLDVKSGESVVIPDDGNDGDLIAALEDTLEDIGASSEVVSYPEPENHGEEPPERVAEKMKDADVFIAPTSKSLSHTDARREANEAGARGATLPGITKEIWKTSLQADYSRVRELSEHVYGMLEHTNTVRVETPSGTELEIKIDIDLFEKDTGLMHDDGSFGNLPAGEADGASVDATGKLVVDHLPILDGAEGAVIHVEDNEVQRIENGDELAQKFDEIDGAENVAEFGFGTNPEAEIIGNILNDEKVFGTVHVAFGDNSSYVERGDDRRFNCPIHWDVICLEPTAVYFDDRKVLDEGEPTFLDEV